MSESETASRDRYHLCIVGAGIAGLNAAFVASQYLPLTTRVLVLDKHLRAGGMWNDAYSYVRLHQPYKMFTAGNIAWSLGRERSYLATRDEVAAHLRHCFDVISERLDVDARWGWECLDHREDGGSVVVTARGPDGELRSFEADRFIDATGFDLEYIAPLPLASVQVRSIAPKELGESGLLRADNTDPVWIIGSGKTAMDTIVVLAQANPARKIGMVSGTGTYFSNRDIVFPTGQKRWVGGVRTGAIFAAAAKRFDGTNAAEVGGWFRDSFATSPLGDPPPTHNLFGVLSEAETATVTTGVSEVIRDHLADVVDDASGPVMLLRTGAQHPIPSGSWLVNCTGHFAPRTVEHKPYVSPSGRTMSINSTSTTLGFSSLSAYFLSHLFFLDRLADAPLYAVDFNGLRRNAPDAAVAVLSSLIMYNLSIVSERVPIRVFRNNGLDFDRWYPQLRQLVGQIQFMRTHKRDRQHHRRALDTFSQHANVRCGPLAATVSSSR